MNKSVLTQLKSAEGSCSIRFPYLRDMPVNYTSPTTDLINECFMKLFPTELRYIMPCIYFQSNLIHAFLIVVCLGSFFFPSLTVELSSVWFVLQLLGAAFLGIGLWAWAEKVCINIHTQMQTVSEQNYHHSITKIPQDSACCGDDLLLS